MKRNAAAFGTGALFAVGLAISGMTKPSKVVGFLDLAGAWDASLAFVMVGAISVYGVTVLLARRRGTPWLAPSFVWPTTKSVDARLLGGAALFGVGWGLGGFCPGPGLVAAGAGSLNAVVFVTGLTIGMLLEHAIARASTRTLPHGDRSRPAP